MPRKLLRRKIGVYQTVFLPPDILAQSRQANGRVGSMVKRERGPGGPSGGSGGKAAKLNTPWVDFVLETAQSLPQYNCA